MTKFLKDKLQKRIDNSQCLVCGLKLTENKVEIYHSIFGNIQICIDHMKDKEE